MAYVAEDNSGLVRSARPYLEKLCKDRGLDATGSKADLLARLTEPVAA